MKKKLCLYSHCFCKEEIENLLCLADYEIEEAEFTQEWNNYQDAEEQMLFVIRRPTEVDGLWELIDHIEKNGMNAIVLLLIEQQDFDMVYEASKHSGVRVYYEKNQAEWKGCIENCLSYLRFIEQVQRDKVQLESYEYQKNHKIMERLLVNILQKPEEVEFLLPEINKRYGTHLGDGDYQAIVINVDQYELYGKSSHFLKEVTLLAIHVLSSAKEIIMGYQEPYGLIGIVHYNKERDIARRNEDYRKLWERVSFLQERYGKYQATLAVGQVVDSISKVSESLKEAAKAKEYCFALNCNFIYAPEVCDSSQDMERYLSERKRKELVRYVTMGDVRHVNSWFLDFHQNIEPTFMKYPPAFGQFCWDVYSDMVEQEKSSQSSIFPEWRFFSLQHIYDGRERNRQLEILLLEICHMMAQGMNAEQEVATKAIAYMKVHFKEPINLEFIAEKCGLSTSYFSRKFKEQTGENYIDVLTDIRIREAQKLLGTTDMSIMEIIEEVGYCDDKHFRKLFSKVTGLKPTEYRKKIRAEKNFM